MNSGSGAVACEHGEQKTVPKRRFRQRVLLPRPVPGTRSRRRASQPQHDDLRKVFNGLRGGSWSRPALSDATCLMTCLHGRRPPSTSTDAAVAQGGRHLGDGPRFARNLLAPFGRQSTSAYGGHTRLCSHTALHHSRERPSGRLGRAQAQEEGLQGPCGGVWTLWGTCCSPCLSVRRTSRSELGRANWGRGRPGGGHGRVRGTGLRRPPGLHRGERGPRSGGGPRHWPGGGGQARRGQAGLRLVAQEEEEEEVGGCRRARFRMGIMAL